MSATAGNTDSGLSGQPSDDIDKQKGPSTGSNVESVSTSQPTGQPSDNIDQQKGPSTGSNVESSGGTLGTATAPVKSGKT
ncbi:unnamed protein product [Adineta steineri]|uniref:Uncharacterized protein n=1 Tax=Adineta steineri TaxID=433720 RepID=A0A820AYC5_9BILA|nr:unnamed protein product [Adineta steineri]CAF4192532.1 unnamed protein product [Adineta steineri]